MNHIARYVESFESQANEIWLVFSYEGLSLSKLLYAMEDAYGTSEKERLEQAKHVQILRPSKWWHWMKTTEEGQAEMRNLIWQLVRLNFRFCGVFPCLAFMVPWHLKYTLKYVRILDTALFPPGKSKNKSLFPHCQYTTFSYPMISIIFLSLFVVYYNYKPLHTFLSEQFVVNIRNGHATRFY